MPKPKVRMIDEKATISVTVLEQSLGNLAYEVAQWIAEYGPDARLNLSSYRDDTEVNACIYFTRPETEAELKVRTKKKKAVRAKLQRIEQASATEKRERQELVRLLKKFGEPK